MKRGNEKNFFKKCWKFVWYDDSILGWITSLLVIFLVVKFIFFPFLFFVTGTPLPLVVVESCSMYHQNSKLGLFSNFDNWWESESSKYEKFGINKEEFEKFNMHNGFNKGDIIFAVGTNSEKVKKGDIIIFQPNSESIQQTPIIHRIASTNPIGTIGDNNPIQFKLTNNQLKLDESSIKDEQLIGRAVFKVPLVGWTKLIFFDWKKPSPERGFC